MGEPWEVRSLIFHDPDESIHLTFAEGDVERKTGTIWDAVEWAAAAHLTIMEISASRIRWERIGRKPVNNSGYSP